MAPKPPAMKKGCPFWSPQTRRCLVNAGGLYIPLDEHVDAFCITAQHCDCLQFLSQGDKGDQLVARLIEEKINRRQYRRIPVEHPLKLMCHPPTGEGPLTDPARLIDLSRGGMRVHTDCKLKGDTQMRFAFEPALADNFTEGLGQVAWCHREIGQDGYQAGIIFQGPSTIKAITGFLHSRHHNA